MSVGVGVGVAVGVGVGVAVGVGVGVLVGVGDGIAVGEGISGAKMPGEPSAFATAWKHTVKKMNEISDRNKYPDSFFSILFILAQVFSETSFFLASKLSI